MQKSIFKILSSFILLVFIINTILPVPIYAQTLNLPPVGQMVLTSPAYSPAIVKGIKIFPDNPLRFDFIVDTGDSKLEGEQLKKESEKLIKYFLASLTTPEEDIWVNLSPYEKDRIIPNLFGQTEMGRDLLSQDYILKQLTASLMYPEDELGEAFWDQIFEKVYEKYGTTEIPINTFNKVWIMPSEAHVYESEDTVYIFNSRLKVMLEKDYLALEKNSYSEKFETNQLDSNNIKKLNDLSSAVVRNVILPAIEKEVNEGEHFASLRQIYSALILATWYKQNLKKSLLGQVYSGKNKIKGIDIEDKQVKEKIYQQYLDAFKEGVYDYIRDDFEPSTQRIISRKYFSGGFGGAVKIVSSPMSQFSKSSTMGESLVLVGGMLDAIGGNFGSSPIEVNLDVPLQLDVESLVKNSFPKSRYLKMADGNEYILDSSGQTILLFKNRTGEGFRSIFSPRSVNELRAMFPIELKGELKNVSKILSLPAERNEDVINTNSMPSILDRFTNLSRSGKVKGAGSISQEWDESTVKEAPEDLSKDHFIELSKKEIEEKKRDYWESVENLDENDVQKILYFRRFPAEYISRVALSSDLKSSLQGESGYKYYEVDTQKLKQLDSVASYEFNLDMPEGKKLGIVVGYHHLEKPWGRLLNEMFQQQVQFEAGSVEFLFVENRDIPTGERSIESEKEIRQFVRDKGITHVIDAHEQFSFLNHYMDSHGIIKPNFRSGRKNSQEYTLDPFVPLWAIDQYYQGNIYPQLQYAVNEQLKVIENLVNNIASSSVSTQAFTQRKEDIFSGNIDQWLETHRAHIKNRTEQKKAVVNELISQEEFISLLYEIPEDDLPLEIVRYVVKKDMHLLTSSLYPFFKILRQKLPENLRKKVGSVNLPIESMVFFITALNMPSIQEYLNTNYFRRLQREDKFIALIDKMESLFDLELKNVGQLYSVLPSELSDKVLKEDFKGGHLPISLIREIRKTIKSSEIQNFLESSYFKNIRKRKKLNVLREKLLGMGLNMTSQELYMALPFQLSKNITILNFSSQDNGSQIEEEKLSDIIFTHRQSNMLNIRKSIFGINVESWLEKHTDIKDQSVEDSVDRLLKDTRFLSYMSNVDSDDAGLAIIKFAIDNQIYLGTFSYEVFLKELKKSLPKGLKKKVKINRVLIHDYVTIISFLGSPGMQNYLNDGDFKGLSQYDKLYSLTKKLEDLGVVAGNIHLGKIYSILPFKLSNKVLKEDVSFLDISKEEFERIRKSIDSEDIQGFLRSEEFLDMNKEDSLVELTIRILDHGEFSIGKKKLDRIYEALPEKLVDDEILILKRDFQKINLSLYLLRQVRGVLKSSKIRNYLKSEKFLILNREDKLAELVRELNIKGLIDTDDLGRVFTALPKSLGDQVWKKDFQLVEVSLDDYDAIRDYINREDIQIYLKSNEFLELSYDKRVMGIANKMISNGLQIKTTNVAKFFTALSNKLSDTLYKSEMISPKSEPIQMASSSIKGGIDFNPNNLNIETQGKGIEYNAPIDLQLLESLISSPIEGFSPVIFNITPILNLPQLLGLNEQDEPFEQSKFPAEEINLEKYWKEEIEV
ncbi:hypothetical protein MNBD_UNCLBAC01-1307 [hydrothermal vent metagenome]|uniref:Uncharacterized protein n=1 Tax=hydrothermal vent metagenome TaxID=652676 RepID=A0A3B1DJ63_9ZZZZ